MASIIEQLYHGRVRPFERDTPLPSEHKAAALEARDAIKALCDSLTPEQKALMEKAQNTQDLLSGFELREMYSKGVCFGVRLMMEVWILTEGGEDDGVPDRADL